VANKLYDFVWNEFCDWYLEIAKVQLQTGTEAEQRATRRTLIRTLESILRLAHPLIPFISESLWQVVAPVAGMTTLAGLAGAEKPSISITDYPTPNLKKIDPDAIAYVNRLKGLVDVCRTLRGEMNVSPSVRLPLLVLSTDAEEMAFLKQAAPVLKTLGKLSEVKLFSDQPTWSAQAQTAPVAAFGLARLCLFMEIDVVAEKARLAKEMAKLEAEISKARTKLRNEAFVAKAPPAVIEQENKRVADFEAKLTSLSDQLKRLG
jgi:valyl-tRNA synthetase